MIAPQHLELTAYDNAAWLPVVEPTAKQSGGKSLCTIGRSYPGGVIRTISSIPAPRSDRLQDDIVWPDAVSSHLRLPASRSLLRIAGGAKHRRGSQRPVSSCSPSRIAQRNAW